MANDWIVSGDGLWLVCDDTLYRLDDPRGHPDMDDRAKAIAEALCELVIRRLDSG